MTTIRDKVKAIVQNQVAAQAIPSKYRLSTVQVVNPDGTVGVMVDGGALRATALYPVVVGEQVAVILADDGAVHVVPTRAKLEPVPFEHPPFFTGGHVATALVEYQGLPGTITQVAFRFQTLGTNKIYRWVINPGASTVLNSIPNVAAFSPNGQYFAYASSLPDSVNAPGSPITLPVGSVNKIAVIKIGANFTSAGTIPVPSPTNTFPQGFFLKATEPTTINIAGLDLAETLFPDTPPPGQVTTLWLLRYSVTSIFVSNDGQVFWTEMLSKKVTYTFTTSGECEQDASLHQLCTYVNGAKKVLGSLSTGGTLFNHGNGTFTFTFNGSGINGDLYIPNITNWPNALPSSFLPGTTALGPAITGSSGVGIAILEPGTELMFGFRQTGYLPTSILVTQNFPPAPITTSAIDAFQLNSAYGTATPFLLQEFKDGSSLPEQILANWCFTKTRSAMLYYVLPYGSPGSVLAVLEVDISKVLSTGDPAQAVYTRFLVTGNVALTFSPAFPNFITWGDSDDLRLCIQPSPDSPISTARLVAYKMKTNAQTMTTEVQTDQYICTPNPPDAGYTKFQIRTANYDTLQVPTVPNSAILALAAGIVA